jgi:hypothetical protein
VDDFDWTSIDLSFEALLIASPDVVDENPQTSVANPSI